jgi:SAM-dependent methyltransferase
VAREDPYASAFGAVYSAYMERPRLSRLIGRVVWGGDTRPYYDSMSAVDHVPAGGMVIDCPCGAGPALRALSNERRIRYVAVDLSPSMLRRARKRARNAALTNVEFLRADATDLPFPAGSADLFLSYWGLHCFADPERAIAEAARVLGRDGRLVGATFVRGSDTLRQRLLVRPDVGDFGKVATSAELVGWFADAGLRLVDERQTGPMWYFEAVPG